MVDASWRRVGGCSCDKCEGKEVKLGCSTWPLKLVRPGFQVTMNMVLQK